MFPASPEANAEVPSGFMVFYPDNIFFGSMGNRITLEFFKDVVQASLLTVLIVWAGVSSFFSRLGFALGVGLLAGATTNLSLAIWYGFPVAYALAAASVTLLGYLAAGVGIAIILPRASLRAEGKASE